MSKWHGGKGSKRRPEDTKKFNDNWDRIFNKDKKESDRPVHPAETRYPHLREER